MSLVAEKHFGPDRGDFSLYFLYSLPKGFELPPSDSEEAFELMKTFTQPCIALQPNRSMTACSQTQATRSRWRLADSNR